MINVEFKLKLFDMILFKLKLDDVMALRVKMNSNNFSTQHLN
jgi:hypothetical protein